MSSRPDEARFAEEARRNEAAEATRREAEFRRSGEQRAADTIVLTEFVHAVAEAGRRVRAQAT